MDWHEGETCDQFDERRKQKERKEEAERAEQEAKSQKVIETTTKKCPGKDCGYQIYKYTGCDHMTCKHRMILIVC